MESNENRLTQLRENEGISQRTLGLEIGISYPAIQKIEAGKADPKWSTILKLCNRFRCSAAYLMGRTDDPILYKYQSMFSDEEIALALDLIQRVKSTL